MLRLWLVIEEHPQRYENSTYTHKVVVAPDEQTALAKAGFTRSDYSCLWDIILIDEVDGHKVIVEE